MYENKSVRMRKAIEKKNQKEKKKKIHPQDNHEYNSKKSALWDLW